MSGSAKKAATSGSGPDIRSELSGPCDRQRPSRKRIGSPRFRSIGSLRLILSIARELSRNREELSEDVGLLSFGPNKLPETSEPHPGAFRERSKSSQGPTARRLRLLRVNLDRRELSLGQSQVFQELSHDGEQLLTGRRPLVEARARLARGWDALSNLLYSPHNPTAALSELACALWGHPSPPASVGYRHSKLPALLRE